jgi:hypothetical protein
VTVPLAHDGRIVGVLSCYASVAQGFTEDHLRLLELLAASLASALVAVSRADAPALPLASNGSRRVGGSNVLTMAR